MSALLGLARWRAHCKKDRIDTFYERVLAARDRMGGEAPAALPDELANLEREACRHFYRSATSK